VADGMIARLRALERDAPGDDSVSRPVPEVDAGINFPEAIALARDSLSPHLRPDLAPLAHFVLADLYNRVGRAQDAAREVSLGQGRR
jgi:hypothetical protein